MNKRRYMLVWSVWGPLIAAALLSACGANDASREIARIEDQIAKTQATVERADKDRESLNATVVAGQQELASLQATAEALRRDLSSQVDGDLLVPQLGQGEADQLYAVPTAIQRTNRSDGWTDYTVYVAFVNDSNKALSLNLFNVRPIIETVEEFTYTGNWIGHWSADLPAKFRSAGRMGEGEVYRASFTFSAASSANPSVATVDGFGTIDLSQTPSVTYPTTKLPS